MSRAIKIDSEKIRESIKKSPYPQRVIASIIGYTESGLSCSLARERMLKSGYRLLCNHFGVDEDYFLPARSESYTNYDYLMDRLDNILKEVEAMQDLLRSYGGE